MATAARGLAHLLAMARVPVALMGKHAVAVALVPAPDAAAAARFAGRGQAIAATGVAMKLAEGQHPTAARTGFGRCVEHHNRGSLPIVPDAHTIDRSLEVVTCGR